jgi:anti-anti-sigma regulatory factor
MRQLTTVSTSAMNLMSRRGNATFDCGGAQIRGHYRHLATVVTILGTIDAANADRIREYTRRFILMKNPLILDLSAVNSFAEEGISFLHLLDQDCRAAELEWILVASHAVTEQLRAHDNEARFAMTPSVHDALHHFADVIAERRQQLLQLIRNTA